MPQSAGQFALGLEGLALLRIGVDASDDVLHHRVAELVAITRLLDQSPLNEPAAGPELPVAAGYAAWAPTYDARYNPMLAAEEPAVREIVSTWPQSWRVLDAACGTGRHTEWLHQHGYPVVGLDASPAMLALARSKTPAVEYLEGDLNDLPFETAEFDAAVCALALEHQAAPDQSLRELARVVRPGGEMVISDSHPFMVLLGGQAAFRDQHGARHFVRNHLHSIGSMLRAVRHAALEVRECAEPTWTLEMAQATFEGISEALYNEALRGLPMAIVWHLVRT